MSTRTFSPAVAIANVPGKDCALLGAYSVTLPVTKLLFIFLKLSPPSAASAALANSVGVLLSVIGGGAGITLASAFKSRGGSVFWANADEVKATISKSARPKGLDFIELPP